MIHRHNKLNAKRIKTQTNRCIKVRDRLGNEITKLMNLLEEAIRHPAFESMDTERKDLYHTKWHTYLKKCYELNGN